MNDIVSVGMDHYLKVKNISLSYSVEGSGGKVLLAFHGFGQNKIFLKPLVKAFSPEYTVYSFDLFFHGKSVWDEKLILLTKEFWKEIIGQFLIEKKIDRFSLLGFSMGGKFALAIIESFPQRVQEVFLLAPDGIKTSFWYSLATYPRSISWMFKQTIHKPDIFKNFVKMIRYLRLVDKGLLRFAESQMNTEEKRRRVYNSWMVFKAFKFNLRSIANLINDNNIKLIVYLGKYDKIITAKNMNKLFKWMPVRNLVVLESGHNHLISEVAQYYSKQKARNNSD